MKIAFFALVAAALIASHNATALDVYKVKVTRKDQDIYVVEGGQTLYIKTAYCYEYAMWEDAVVVLKSQPFQGSIAIGKIVFTNGWTLCQVDSILQ